MVLKIWDNGGKTADRYTVRIRNDYYYMSHNANMPNGVCMYAGQYGEFNEKHISGKLFCGNGQREHSYKYLPIGLRKQITELS